MKKLVSALFSIVVYVVILAGVFVGVSWYAYQGPFLPPEPLPDVPIIDMHMHIACVQEENGCFLNPRLKESLKYDLYLHAFGVSEKDLLEKGDGVIFDKLNQGLMESKHVDSGVALAMDAVYGENGIKDLSQTEVEFSNSFVASQAKLYSKIHFGASVHPNRKDALFELERVKKLGAKLVKWIPSIQMIDPSDEKYRDFYQKLVELDLPLLVHTGNERSFTISDDRLGDPVLIELPLKMGVTVIAAHVATTGEKDAEEYIDRLLPLFSFYPNLYADISSLTQINKRKYLPKILSSAKPRGRLLYGSDVPLISVPFLVSPIYFPFNLKWPEILRIMAISNPWDQDVELKRALGVPSSVFSLPAKILR